MMYDEIFLNIRLCVNILAKLMEHGVLELNVVESLMFFPWYLAIFNLIIKTVYLSLLLIEMFEKLTLANGYGFFLADVVFWLESYVFNFFLHLTFYFQSE